ncbi:MAG: hypothetical protein AB7O32_00145 [Vicinamibacterales bacterium]
MATTYVYSDWASQATQREQYTRLNLHIAEISATLAGPDVSADGRTITKSGLRQTLDTLLRERVRLEAIPGVLTTGAPKIGAVRILPVR